MNIQQKDDGKTGMFFIEQDDRRVAELIYSWKDKDRIIIEHTGVEEVLKGKGAGKELLAKTVKFARKEGIKIIPVCSFAKRIFDKTDEYKDVL